MARESSVDPLAVEKACVELLSQGESPSFPAVFALLGRKGSAAVVQGYITDFKKKIGTQLGKTRLVPGLPPALVEASDRHLAEIWQLALHTAEVAYQDARLNLDSERAAMQELIENYSEKFSDLEREVLRLNGKLDAQTVEIAGLIEARQAIQDRLLTAEATLNERDGQLAETRVAAASLRATLDSDRAIFVEKLDAVHQQHADEVSAIHASHETRIRDLTQQHRAELDRNQAIYDGEKRHLHEQTDAIRQANRQEIDRLKKEIVSLTASLEVQIRAANSAREAIARVSGKIEMLEEIAARERARADDFASKLAISVPGEDA